MYNLLKKTENINKKTYSILNNGIKLTGNDFYIKN